MKTLRKNGGFTLVELVVVIAILAILAGVAVPAYSGYISKANKAADTSTLTAVNTAIASACAENGVNVEKADEYIAVSATTTKITITKATNDTVGSVFKAFQTYYNNSATSIEVTLKSGVAPTYTNGVIAFE